MTLEDFLIMSRRRLVLLLISVAVGGALGYLVAWGVPGTYTATSTAYVRASAPVSRVEDVNAQVYAEERAGRLAAGMVGVVMSDAFPRRITDSLDVVDSSGAFSMRVTASQPVGTSMVVVAAHASSPWLARRVADEAVWQAAAEMEAVGSGLSATDVTLLSSAELGAVTRSPSVSRSVATGALGTLALAYSWLLLKRGRPGRVQGADEIVRGTGKPVLGNLSPSSVGVSNRGATTLDDRVEEEIRRLRTNLFAKGVRVVAVCSVSRREGRTTVCLGLARAIAMSGRDVVVVEADTCEPVLADLYQAKDAPALLDLLNRDAASDQGLVATPVLGMSVLPAGVSEHEGSEPFSQENLREVFSALASERMVIVDAPAVGELGSHCESIAAVVDGLLVVASVGETFSGDLVRALERLERSSGGDVIGVVLNHRRVRPWRRISTRLQRVMNHSGRQGAAATRA